MPAGAVAGLCALGPRVLRVLLPPEQMPDCARCVCVCAGAVTGLCALGPRVLRVLLLPQAPAYATLLDKALAAGRPGSVRRCVHLCP